MNTERPRYADLAAFANGERHSWDHYGPDDELGTLNELRPERVQAAAAEIRLGERVDLELPPHLPDPPLFGRGTLRHEIFQTGRNNWDDRIDGFFPQRSTQWDGFRHVRFREHGFYGGVTADPSELDPRLGVHHWAKLGIVGRGVLLDVAAHRQRAGTEVDPFTESVIDREELLAVAAAQGTDLRPGDILCIRTGWTSRYLAADAAERAAVADPGQPSAFIGLSSATDLAAHLWDAGIAALAADNPAVESSPGDPAIGSLHRRLLAQLGMPLGELFDFDALAARCAIDARWSFFFVSNPLAIVGAVGTPANAIAIR